MLNDSVLFFYLYYNKELEKYHLILRCRGVIHFLDLCQLLYLILKYFYLIIIIIYNDKTFSFICFCILIIISSLGWGRALKESHWTILNLIYLWNTFSLILTSLHLLILSCPFYVLFLTVPLFIWMGKIHLLVHFPHKKEKELVAYKKKKINLYENIWTKLSNIIYTNQI